MKKRFFIYLFLILLGTLSAAFENPYKVAVNRAGEYYVADTLRNKVEKYSRAGKLLTVITHSFDQPQAVAVDSNNNLYILDTGNNRILKFYDSPGGSIKYLKELPLQLNYPRDIEVSYDDQYLYVLDSGNGQVIRIEIADGNERQDIVFGEFDNPYGLAIDPEGYVYVADTGNHRIVKFNQDGKYLASYGRRGKRKGEFYYPKDVVVGFSKKLIVADSGNYRIQRMSETGNFIKTIAVVSKKEFVDIRGLALDKQNGYLYISSAGNEIDVVDLGFKIKSARLENNYLSPNGDDHNDKAIFKVELIAQTDLSLAVREKGSASSGYRVEGDKGVNGLQYFVWDPQKKITSGVYDFDLICSDAKGEREPYIMRGEFYVDLTPPEILSLTVTPAVLSPDRNGIDDELIYIARISEPAILQANFYFGPDREFFADVNNELFNIEQTLKWNGTNKYKEIVNGKYYYELVAIDQAGNISKTKRGQFDLSFEHPIIFTASLDRNKIKPGDKVILDFKLLQDAKVEIALESLTGGRVHQFVKRSYARGDYSVELTTKDTLGSEEYTLLIRAVSDTHEDDYYNRLIVDGDPPQMIEPALSKDIIWGGGIDYTQLTFRTDENALVSAYLKDKESGLAITDVGVQESHETGELISVDFDGLNALSEIIAKGEYRLVIVLEDDMGNISESGFDLRIAGNSPEINNFELSTQVLAPLGDGTKVSVEFSYDIAESIGDLYVTLKIYKDGEVVSVIADRQYRFRGNNFDYWYVDNTFEDGIYIYEITVHDDHGHSTQVSGELYVIANRPLIHSFDQSVPAISPMNADGINDEVIFSGTIEISPTLLVSEESDDVYVYIDIGEEEPLRYLTNAGAFNFVWDGKVGDTFLIDALYDISIYCVDSAGNQSDFVTTSVIIANSLDKVTSLSVTVEATPNIGQAFNPYGSDTTATLNFYMPALLLTQTVAVGIYDSGSVLVKSWNFNVNANQSGFYTYPWTGEDNSNNYVNDGIYNIQILVTDPIGNISFYSVTRDAALQINLKDGVQLVTPDGTLYSQTSVKYNVGNIEVNYVKGPPISLGSGARQDISTWNFYIDKPYTMAGTDWTCTNACGSNATIIGPGGNWGWNSGGYCQNTYYRGSAVNFQRALYKLYVYQHQFFYLDVYQNDVWYRKLDLTSEIQVGLDATGVNAVDRGNRLAMIRTSVSSAAKDHVVSVNASNIVYRRRANIGSGLWTSWIQISETGKICSEPSITAGNSDDTYVSWIQQDTAGGDKYVVAQKVPENFRPVNDSGFFLVSMVGIAAETSLYKIQGISSVMNIISPADGNIIAESRPIFIWQAPTWGVTTSTNYKLSISPDNSSFLDADDDIYDLTPSEVSFSGVSDNIISYKLLAASALDAGLYFSKVGAMDSPAGPVLEETPVISFRLIPDLEVTDVINYPNPFSDTTTIRYKLSKDADVTVRIFNIAGQLVREMNFSQGFEGAKATSYFDKYNDIEWNGKNDLGKTVVNGAYVYEIVAESGSKKVKARGRMLVWK